MQLIDSCDMSFKRRDIRSLIGLLLILSVAMSEGASAEPASQALSKPPFVEGIYCGVCHSNSRRAVAMRDVKERAIAPFDLWRSSAMANAVRDPYWRAVVSVEVAATPARKAEIEATCTRCHAPMAGPVSESPEGQLLSYLQQGDERSFLARDGVSCTVCHQITDDGLGTEASYTGNFKISANRVAYGPHEDLIPMSMKQHIGYTAMPSQHILKSALCATCHTLITETLTPMVQQRDINCMNRVLTWSGETRSSMTK